MIHFQQALMCYAKHGHMHDVYFGFFENNFSSFFFKTKASEFATKKHLQAIQISNKDNDVENDGPDNIHKPQNVLLQKNIFKANYTSSITADHDYTKYMTIPT